MKHEESKHDGGSHGLAIRIHVHPEIDVDATVKHVREVIECIVSAGRDGVAVSGEIGMERTMEYEVPADHEPEPPEETNYHFPPFKE
jgi:hypothetical protein